MSGIENDPADDGLIPVEDLVDPSSATGPLVDADSGRRPSPFTDDALRRLRIRGYHHEYPSPPDADTTAEHDTDSGLAE